MSGHAPFFFAEPAVLAAAHLTIEGEDARHLAVVRRASPGDLVRISDGRGTIADARLTSVTPASVGAEVLERTVTPAPSPRVAVHQGLAKGDKVDGVIRHLVEMGVDGIVVFEAGRSVARWDGARQAAAGRRWATIAREAAKQSHRAWLPVLAGPLPGTEAAAAPAGGGLGLVAHRTGPPPPAAWSPCGWWSAPKGVSPRTRSPPSRLPAPSRCPWARRSCAPRRPPSSPQRSSCITSGVSGETKASSI